jgi:hypothetical protein
MTVGAVVTVPRSHCVAAATELQSAPIQAARWRSAAWRGVMLCPQSVIPKRPS